MSDGSIRDEAVTRPSFDPRLARMTRGRGPAVVLLVVLSIVLSILAVVMVPAGRRFLSERSGSALAARAALAATAVGRQVEGTAATLEVLVGQPRLLSAFEQRDFGQVEKQLRQLVSGPLGVQEVLLTDPDGRQLWRFPSDIAARGRDHSLAPWKAAIDGSDGRWVASLDADDFPVAFHVAVPIRAVTGSIQAYLVTEGRVDLPLQGPVVEGSGEEELAVVTDSRAAFGTGGPPGAESGWRVISHPATGAATLQASAPVSGTSWSVIASRPLDSVIAPLWAVAGIVVVMGLALYVPMTMIGMGWVRLLRRDVEARDRMGQQLRQTKESLEERVRERTEEMASLNRRMAEELDQRARAEEALKESEERYRVVAETAADAVLTFDATGFLLFASQATETIFGRSSWDVVGKPLALLVPEGLEPLLDAGRTGEGSRTPLQLVGRHAGGDEVQLEVSVASYTVERERMFTAIARDVTDRTRLQKLLRESEERYALAARGANDGLWDWDLPAGVVYYSPRWKAMLGYRDGEIGSSPSEWLDRVDPEDRAALEEELRAHVEGNVPHFQSQHRIRRRDGSVVWVLARGLAVREAGVGATRIAGSLTDVTERKMAEDRLAHEALHDALTGLPNRAMFMERLGQVLERADRESQDPFAVLFLDLDGFKVINDSLGHTFGDKVLVGVARRLESCIRPGDTLARLGGDEFVVLLGGADRGTSERIAERIQGQLGKPLYVEGQEIFTSASIGIAFGSPRYERAEELLRDADVAMYRAKGAGKAQFKSFDRSMRQTAVGRLQGETELRKALERQAMVLHYQPILELESGRLVAFEALVRWLHPERGLLPAKEFIQLAEETGLILPLGSWVLAEAVRQLGTWRHEMADPPSALRMNVNLSGLHFGRPDLVSEIQRLLDVWNVPAEDVVLEITEGILMDRDEETTAVLAGLQALGTRLCLDDFGTGYCSLSYLHEVPISMVKIDQSFIHRLGGGDPGVEIVRAILALGEALDLDVVAEGVETEEQLEFLRSLACPLAQGFHLGRPTGVEGAASLLRRIS